MKNLYQLLIDNGVDLVIDVNKELENNPYLISKLDQVLLSQVNEETLDHVVENVTLPDAIISLFKNFKLTPEQVLKLLYADYLNQHKNVIDVAFDFIVDSVDAEKYILHLFDGYTRNHDLIINHLGEKINTLLNNVDLLKLANTNYGLKLLFNEYVNNDVYLRCPELIKILLSGEYKPLLNNDKLTLWQLYYHCYDAIGAFDDLVFMVRYTDYSKHNHVESPTSKNFYMDFIKEKYPKQYKYLLDNHFDSACYHDLVSKYGTVGAITNDQFLIIIIENEHIKSANFMERRVIEIYNDPKYLPTLLKNNIHDLYYIKSDNYECKNLYIDYYFENLNNYRNNIHILEFFIMRDYYKNPYAKSRLDEFLAVENMPELEKMFNHLNLYQYNNVEIILGQGIDIEKFIDVPIEQYYIKYVNHYKKQDKD